MRSEVIIVSHNFSLVLLAPLFGRAVGTAFADIFFNIVERHVCKSRADCAEKWREFTNRGKIARKSFVSRSSGRESGGWLSSVG